MSGMSTPNRGSPSLGRGNSAYSPEETARLFFQHLVDNIGQFQQLYDGLFRWKMNDAGSLPSFNLVRPHFRDVLLASGAQIGSAPATTAMPKEESEEEMGLDRSTSSVGESILNQITQLLESGEQPVMQGSETPYETASESGNVSRDDIDVDTSKIYERLYGHLVKKPGASAPMPFAARKPQPIKDTFWEADKLRSFYENVIPQSSRSNTWLEEPLTAEDNLDEDFDFEGSLAMFQKIPLEGSAARVASANAKKQEKVIRRLFKRARTQTK